MFRNIINNKHNLKQYTIPQTVLSILLAGHPGGRTGSCKVSYPPIAHWQYVLIDMLEGPGFLLCLIKRVSMCRLQIVPKQDGYHVLKNLETEY